MELKSAFILICLFLCKHVLSCDINGPKLSSSNYQVVGVQSTPYYGSSVPVLIDEKLLLLTNSHVLNYQSQITKTVFKVPMSDGSVKSFSNAKLDFKLDHADIAFVELPSNLSNEIYNRLCSIARSNVQFVSSEKSLKGFITFPKKLEGITAIFPKKHSYIINFKNVGVELIRTYSTFEPKYIPDLYISGLYQNVILLPIFGYRGLSGSAYYYGGELRGILTKVGLGAYPDGYLIPIEEIAKIVSAHYFNEENLSEEYNFFLSIDRLESLFSATRSATIQEFNESDQINYLSDKINVGGETGNVGGETGNVGGETGNVGGETGNVGGETGNVGGETGNVGGETGNVGGETGNVGGKESSLWYFQLEKSEKLQVTQNPFILSNENFESQKIYQIDFNKEKTQVFVAQTSAKTNWLTNDDVKKKYNFDWLEVDYKKLNEQRLKNATIHYPKYARIYYRNKKNTNHYELLTYNLHSYIGESVQALFPEGIKDGLSKPGIGELAAPPLLSSAFNSAYDGSYKFRKDSYFEGKPLMSKRASKEKNIFTSIKSHPEINDYYGIYSPGFFEIIVPKDLSFLEYYSEKKDPIKLRLTKQSLFQKIYQSQDKKLKATIIFQTDDISKIDRVFFQTKSHLFELIVCVPGETCFR